MSIFDASFKAVLEDTFAEPMQWLPPNADPVEFFGFFDKGPDVDRLNGAPVSRQRTTIEWDSEKYPMAIKINAVISIRDIDHRVTSNPIADDIGMAMCSLVLV